MGKTKTSDFWLRYQLLASYCILAGNGIVSHHVPLDEVKATKQVLSKTYTGYEFEKVPSQ